jgi:pyruvate dehydrogenase E2 component (dihydrolipoamide acetyltransferase)
MPVEITMPQLSDTMSEGTVVKWHKKEGDKIKSGEKIADVETDKAVMEMEAFESGTLAHISAAEGAKVAVGGTIAYLATGKEDPKDVKSKFASGASAAPARRAESPKPTAKAAGSAGGNEVKPSAPVATMEHAARSEVHEPDEVGHGATRQAASPVPPLQHGNGRRIFASPLAKRIAEDKGIDLNGIKGSGPYGRIVQKDVLEAADKPAGGVAASAATESAAPAKPAAAPMPARVLKGEKQAIPLSKMRTVIAARLQAAKQKIPHIYVSVDIDMEEISALRERLNASLEKQKIRLSIGDLIAKAVASSLQQHPAVNAHFDEKNNQIIRFGDVNLGMAVALPDGLIVPVLRGIDQMGFKEIRQRSADLIDRARAQKLKQDEMSGATFTVTNLGTFGVKDFNAIINPPEVAILAISSAEKRAVVRNDQIVPRLTMTVTLSADHRAIDGAVAADFLRTLKSMMEDPGSMLI